MQISYRLDKRSFFSFNVLFSSFAAAIFPYLEIRTIYDHAYLYDLSQLFIPLFKLVLKHFKGFLPK